MLNDKIFNDMITKFLTTNYPVSRIKSEGRFKRAIIIEGEQPYLLNDKSSVFKVKARLLKTLLVVFDCDVNLANELISKSINI